MKTNYSMLIKKSFSPNFVMFECLCRTNCFIQLHPASELLSKDLWSFKIMCLWNIIIYSMLYCYLRLLPKKLA